VVGTAVALLRGQVQRDDLLWKVYEYQRLLAQASVFGDRLGAESRNRLAQLERDLEQGAQVTPSGPRRRFARASVDLRATLKAGGRVHPVHVVNLGGGGLCVEPAPTLQSGERAVVKLTSAETGESYAYPVEARWTKRSARMSTMGLPFVGVPLRTLSPKK